MEYLCMDKTGKQKKRWTGELHLLRKDNNFYELEITGRGSSFHAMVGHHQYGNFICIPNYDVGSELADYSDIFWNQERLTGQLSKADAITVACALSHIEEL